jgi:hypothetical protein
VQVLNGITEYMNFNLHVDVNYPNDVLELLNYDRDSILSISKNRGWLSEQQLNQNNIFLTDIRYHGFNKALENYQKEMFQYEIQSETYRKMNTFANLMLAMNYQHTSWFNSIKINSNQSLSKKEVLNWRCLGALVALSAATASLLSCVTIAACAGAILLHIIAIDAVSTACGDYMKTNNQ